MNLFLVRHGETEYNKLEKYYGHLDCDLTKKGENQILNLAKILEPINFAYIYSSPLLRAKRTSEIINTKNQKVKYFDELKETNFGEWEGLSHKEILDKGHSEIDGWYEDLLAVTPPNGENFKDVQKRIVKFYEFLLENNSINDNILITSHAGPLKLLILHLLNLSIDYYWSIEILQGVYSHIAIYSEYNILKKLNSH